VDIAGKAIANPTAMILSSAIMLRQLNRSNEVWLIEKPIKKAHAMGTSTRDVGENYNTREFIEEVIKNLGS